MPWPVYSERLLVGSTSNTWTYWTCPEGMRAVVKSIIAANVTAAAGRADVSAAEFVIWIHPFPAAVTAVAEEVMVVVYGGERVGVRTASQNSSVVVCGYVFIDSESSSGPPAGAATLPQLPDPDLDPWSPPA